MKDQIKFACIIVTYRCNCKCHMCNVWQYPTTTAEEITPADIAKLPSIPNINITGGEPFLREDLEEILEVLRPKTQRLVISTNGFWTERVLEVAKKHPWIGVRISLEGLPKANDELRGTKDGFDHGIRTLAELRNMGMQDVGFGITLSDRNAKDLMELYHLAKMMGIEFATAAIHNSFYFHKEDNKFENSEVVIGELKKLIAELLQSRRLKDWFRAYFNYGLINYIKGKPRLLPCMMGRQSFFVDPFGDILPCNGMHEKMSMGNLKKQSFEEIWNGPEADKVRKACSHCKQNCWMIGSVAEPMKEKIMVPMQWIVKTKFLGQSFE